MSHSYPDSAVTAEEQPSTTGLPANLLNGLDEQQREAVLAPRGPVCVLAGAGTGKTRTITRRIAALVHRGLVAEQQVLAVTFTARAAGEMRSRLRELGVHRAQARTFHAAALRQLRYFWPQFVGGELWPVLDRKLRAVSQAARRVGVEAEQDLLRDVTAEIEWAKSNLVSPQDYPRAAAAAGRAAPVADGQLSRIYSAYEEAKNQAEVLDFDDLLLHVAAALEENPGVADEFRSRYRSFVVDEFQDLTPVQHRVLRAWLGPRDDLTVVGDANQTIYSFTGASPRWLLGFSTDFPGAAVIRLERDYRSTGQVVGLANTLISQARDTPAGSRLRLVGQQPDGPEPRFSEHPDEPAEAAAVAERIRELLAEGVAASEIAVLFRINAQSEAYENALAARAVPYEVRGGQRFFARQEVRQAMTALAGAADSPTADSPTADLPASVRAVLGSNPALGLTDEPPEGSAARDRWASLMALVELAEEVSAAEPGADLRRFSAELAARADAQQPPTLRGVTLASLHSAKGLEWRAVFLVGLAEGTLPIQHALADSAPAGALDEERRLLYVGITRAKQHLWLSWSLSRSEGGRQNRRRSRFLHTLIPEDHPAALPSRPAQSSRKRAGKQGLAAVDPERVDTDLLERLREWRRTESAGRKVPAYTVFTDETLLAIAEHRPADDAGLVAIRGIGASKLEQYGRQVLALVRGETVSSGSADTGSRVGPPNG